MSGTSHWDDQAAIHNVEAAYENLEAARARNRPSVIYGPRPFIDGDRWCALLGEDLQNGVCGFGDSPEEAFADFDVAWRRVIATTGETR